MKIQEKSLLATNPPILESFLKEKDKDTESIYELTGRNMQGFERITNFVEQANTLTLMGMCLKEAERKT